MATAPTYWQLYRQLSPTYGDPALNGFQDKFEREHLTRYKLPQSLHWFPDADKVLLVNSDLVGALEKVLVDLTLSGLHREIKTFDGCYNVRRIRGVADAWSVHSFALAIDLNAKTNQLGGEVTFSPAFLQVWRNHKWILGADFKRKDGMHFEYLQHLA
jgi:hypothetical protein